MKNLTPSTIEESFFEIPYYHDFISPSLARHILSQALSHPHLLGLKELGAGGGLETKESLAFLIELYERLKSDLKRVLDQRQKDRKFIDERVSACVAFNKRVGRDFLDADYRTVIGLEDSDGRIVVGPKQDFFCNVGGAPVAEVPAYLKGPHVTLFGPPDSAKMAINAMNAYHRRLPGEPPIVDELLRLLEVAPKWGADDEDSKTPLRDDLIDAGVNLTGCFNRTIQIDDGQKSYRLADSHLSIPLKRFPGLALPATFLFFNDNPLPLHLYDFALHLFANWHNPNSLAFYIPKLENEEEARYIHTMIATAEQMIKARHPEYVLGTVRVMIVLENPRAILRAHEIIDELYPYFVGASLGWHDYLASTARLFKEDPNYRIPVKADPHIVIKYIKASHSLLAKVVGSRGGIKVGGMYGILPQSSDLRSPSFQVALKGFFKDVITQLKRDLDGFWVAHPDFVRIGLAIVEAWRLYQSGKTQFLFSLTEQIFIDTYRQEVDQFIRGDDIKGLSESDPNYVRSLLVADIKVSDHIPNNDPQEVRYNVFQALQYLADWLSGNGCVALPTVIEDVPVRVMDDLATAERSRWEVWHELYHGRFRVEDFLRIAHEELRFIRKDLSSEQKIVQVKWDARTGKWYPVAFKLMIMLMTAKRPVEFATELLMPFTVPDIRNAEDPWSVAIRWDADKFTLDPYIVRWNYFFECCGSQAFATAMAQIPFLDQRLAERFIQGFNLPDVLEAASFHGDIGESPKGLDSHAKMEQAKASQSAQDVLTELRSLGAQYQNKFGFKFLIFAQGRSGEELLEALKQRLNHSKEQELQLAKSALWQITVKRINENLLDDVIKQMRDCLQTYQIHGAQLAVTAGSQLQSISLGDAKRAGSPVKDVTLFELASLSKTIATAFAIEFFQSRNIGLDTTVHSLLAQHGSRFRIRATGVEPMWADQVTLSHLMSHRALNLHYVRGFLKSEGRPEIEQLLGDPGRFGYDPISVIGPPGQEFKYSGGGFLVLEYLIELLAGEKITQLTRGFLEAAGLAHLTFDHHDHSGLEYAAGYFDDGRQVSGGRLDFPAFAAGAVGTASDVLRFLQHLGQAYRDLEGSGPISHDTARLMLHGRDFGCRDFMGCDMGMGVFIADAGDNRFAVHQGANEGFRAIYLYCFAGPDAGKGFVILCNGDNRAVLCIASLVQILLQSLKIQGVNWDRFASTFDFSKLSQEQIVNLGYKHLIFSAFQPRRPEVIRGRRIIDPLSEYNILVGASITKVSDEIFARAENLISPLDPVFEPDLYGRQGKIMDSWETARHNQQVCDVLELKLKAATGARFARISTKYHDGNQAEFVRVLGKVAKDGAWVEIVPKLSMLGHSERRIRMDREVDLMSDVRVEMYPDGGLTRLGLYHNLPEGVASRFDSIEHSVCERYPEQIPSVKKPMTLDYCPTDAEILLNLQRVKPTFRDEASLAFGGRIISASNEHYSPARNVLSPFPPLNMFDGLESARSRTADHFEEVVLALRGKILIGRIVFDFSFFVNNNPLYIQIFARQSDVWVDLVGLVPTKAFAGSFKEIILTGHVEASELKVRTYPDGGINRIHVFAKF
jgi:allantoicase/malate synthase/CubicO group peptidase (beta-lactamase class C family)